jgi:hypothetical protein
MNARSKSLRSMVEKWLAPTPAMPVRITRLRRTHLNRKRSVRVEAYRPAGPLVVLFFLHDDGSWCVFPPETERPTMSVDRIAA